MLAVLIALSVLSQHGQTVDAPDMGGHHVMMPMADAIAAVGQEHGTSHRASGHGMSGACTIVCFGTPTPWLAAAQMAPITTEHPLKWRFMAAVHEGRLIGPGYRPPKSI